MFQNFIKCYFDNKLLQICNRFSLNENIEADRHLLIYKLKFFVHISNCKIPLNFR